MIIDGIYYTEPELMAKFREMQATIDRYEAENRKLTEEKEELGGLYNDASLGIGYLEQRCEELETREKEYKRLLKAAVEDMHNGDGCSLNCNVCKNANEEFYKCYGHPKWRYKDEAFKLIGEEPWQRDTNPS